MTSASTAPWAVYVHVPFCLRRCCYCDFATAAVNADPAIHQRHEREFLAQLHAEIDAAEPRPARTVYLGGGTPTTLPAEQLVGILGHLADRGGVVPGAETTVEANPTTAEAGLFAALRAGGFNRLSLGLQSFNDAILPRLGRTHTAAEGIAAYDTARAAGFDNVSIDLMFALPGQDLDDWRAALGQAVALEPEHVSLYSLTVEHDTPLERMVAEGRMVLPNEDVDADMFELAIDTLCAAGYEHYEISNFARPGRRSEHNQVYWRNEEYRGFGPGAASYVGRTRWVNAGSLRRYVAGDPRLGLGDGGLTDSAESRDDDGERRETMYLGLRQLDGVDIGWYATRYGAPPEVWFGAELERLTGRGLVERREGHWALTRRGLLLANQAFLEFV